MLILQQKHILLLTTFNTQNTPKVSLMNKVAKNGQENIISSKDNNMVNINAMKKKSVWIIRKIFTKLDSLNLRKYYFECAMLILNVMLQSSILYAGETYYNLKEVEIRQIERIEEEFLRKLFKTSRGCPFSQLYL